MAPVVVHREQRRRRALDRRAIRAEFDLAPPRGLVARLRRLMEETEALERARLSSHGAPRQ